MSSPEFSPLDSRFALWQTYDSTVKSDLFSTAVFTDSGALLIDPISLDESGFSQLLALGDVHAVVVTNTNHWRASRQFAERFQVPILAHPASNSSEGFDGFTPITDGMVIGNALQVISIEGAVAGEIALHFANGAGTLIFGDALINLDPYGFTFLPAKYCLDSKQMRRSLRKLLDRAADRLFFAHGMPILSGAGARLRGLLES